MAASSAAATESRLSGRLPAVWSRAGPSCFGVLAPFLVLGADAVVGRAVAGAAERVEPAWCGWAGVGAAEGALGTAGSGSARPARAIAASPVTHTGVWSLERE
jgi:hypothetical protein